MDVEAKVIFPDNSVKKFEFNGDRKFIWQQIMFYSKIGCKIEVRDRW